MRLTDHLIDAVFFLSLRAKDGKIINKWIDRKLAAAALDDMLRLGIIEAPRETGQFVKIISTDPTRHPAHIVAMNKIKGCRRKYGATLRTCIDDLASDQSLRTAVIEHLVRRGALTIEEKRQLFFWTVQRYHPTKPATIEKLASDIEKAILSANPAPAGEIKTIIALLTASQLLKPYREVLENRTYIETQMANSLLGPLLQKSIRDYEDALKSQTSSTSGDIHIPDY